MEKLLTIAIPTYNRKNQLIRLLKSIEAQNCTGLYSIIISDNCSNYSVEDTIDDTFSGEFREVISVKRREVNGGGDYNISSIFAFANSNLFWIVGDDDELLPGSIQKVIDNYRKYPEIPVFKYKMPAAFNFEEDIIMSSVDDLIACHKKGYLLGGIIFVSNNVYNVELVKPFLPDCLYYGYCSISQLIPMMHCLVDSPYDVLLCKDLIVKYNAPEGDHWNYRKIVTSISTTLDISLGNNYKEVKKFFRVIGSYFGVGEFLIDNIKIEDKPYRNYVYWKGINTVFKYDKGFLGYFALSCYWIERLTRIKLLTGVYVWMLNKQTTIQNKFREKARTNASAAKWFYFLKKHVNLMK